MLRNQAGESPVDVKKKTGAVVAGMPVLLTLGWTATTTAADVEKSGRGGFSWRRD